MTRIRTRFLAVAATGALAVTVAACGGGSTAPDGGSGNSGEAGGKGGTLYYYIQDPIEHLDPQRVYVGRDISNLSRTVYRTLVTFDTSTDADQGTTPVPDLATDTGTSSEGGKVWKYTIRDDAKWQDGKAVTCDDFKYGASRVFATDVITGGPNYLLNYLDVPKNDDGLPVYDGPYKKDGQAAFDKAITCDGQTITYNFNKPWPDFPLAIAALHMMDPYRQDKDQGDKSNFQIFSNGPYKLDGSWSKQSGGTFVRNDQYTADSDESNSRKALPDTITYKIGSTTETIYDQLFADSGDDQFAITGNRIPPAYVSQIENAKDRYLNVDSPYVDYVLPNFKRMTNPQVRKALLLATDAQGWIDAGGGTRYWNTADSIVNPAVAGYKANPAFADLSKSGDPDAAKKLLQQAGVKMPYPITFTYPQTDTADKQAAALKQTWDKAGFKTTLEPQGDTYYDVIQKPDNDYDVIWGGWGADWPSAITVTAPLFDSRLNLTAASSGQDYGLYQSKTTNGFFDQAYNASDLDTQTKALQDADAQLGEDVAYIPLEIAKFNWLHGSKVTNFGVTPASNSFPDLGLIGVSS